MIIYMSSSSISDYDLYLFHEGTHYQSYKIFGAHIAEQDGLTGVRFTLWAPNARGVQVVGDFNNWQGHAHVMDKLESSGIWSLFVPDLKEGDLYKYQIFTHSGEVLLKSDAYAFFSERRPDTASRVLSLQGYQWQDDCWREYQSSRSHYKCPINIYEVHLGSWRCGLSIDSRDRCDINYNNDQNDQSLSYRDLAQQLVEYVVEMGYTHIELLPVSEHPYDGSWGYQSTGYFSVTSRYGNPHDFKYFVDCCHQKGLGVILDWVPAHFCKDDCGLRRYDGSALYEYEDDLQGENIQWGTANFDFTKNEVWSFLISNAYFWFDVYHIDGLRVDAVAYMLYLDYCKDPGKWLPNRYNRPENLEAIEFMKKLNTVIFENFPSALMIAEEATHWPMVTYPTFLGGLGYNYKWNMGWMNDILKYMETDPIYRKSKHNLLTFSLMYAFSENFVLPLSHDEVVHGKKSLLDRMPGDYWQKFANLRLLYGYMIAHPGKKLLFMGGEFGQFIEWSYKGSLDWHLLDYDMHGKMHYYVRELNHLYISERCLWEEDGDWSGFTWIDPHDGDRSIISFIRRGSREEDFVIVICNFTPVVRKGYITGVPEAGVYYEVFNSDYEKYGGSGQENNCLIFTENIPCHSLPYSVEITIPPLAVVYLKRINTKPLCRRRKELCTKNV